MKLSKKQIANFQKMVWEYYRMHRRELPWRRTRDPYRIFVSEMMLQQTQVERVVPFYEKFIKMFPTPAALARAPLKSVLRAWSGLGYNRRALFLKRAAEVIVGEHGGEVPRDAAALDALPGVGEATAAAILAYAWNEPVVFVETNVRTVFLHHFFTRRKKVSDEEIVKAVSQTLPLNHSREWYCALMDYGTFLKKTAGNPNVRSSAYAKQKKFTGSRRELRGEILRRAALKHTITPSDFISKSFSVREVLRGLAAEGFLKEEGKRFRLV